MKIVETKVTQVSMPLQAPIRWAYGTRTTTVRNVVQIKTDEGLVGLGESRGSIQVASLISAFGKKLIGEDPFNLERILASMETEPFFHGYDGYSAIGGLEMAVWDIIGKALDRPVYQLIGGLVRRHIPMSGFIFYRHKNEAGVGGETTPDDIVEFCRQAMKEQGFKCLKLKGGVFPPEHDLACIKALREAFGDSVGLRLDPNGVWTPQTTLRIGRKLLEYDLEYLEDPTLGMEGMSLVRRDLPIPLSTNMWVVEFEQIPPAVRLHAVDVILGDPHKWGGILRTKELAAICRTFKLGFCLHSGAELGISTAAYLHLGASTPHLMYAIDSHYHHMTDDIIQGGMHQYVDGGMFVPEGPGLGVALDEEKFQHYAEMYKMRANLKESDEAQYDPLNPTWQPGLQIW
jgi:glucarate dehydratase